ncbi:MAG TPA: secretin N-terminal domain-containing protein [Gemmatimonadaceae bacterium]
MSGRLAAWVAAGALVVAGSHVARADDTSAAAAAGPETGAPAEGEQPLRISMEFESVSLKDILKSFSLQTGLNVIAAGDIGEEPLTLYFENVSVMDALDQILRASSLTYERPAGSDIYVVKPLEARDTTITRVYRLKFGRVSRTVMAKTVSALSEVTPFEAAAVATQFESAGEAGGGGGGGGGEGQVVGIDTILATLLTRQGSITVDDRTNTMVVTDVPENFPRIESALAALDARRAQVLVDTEILETSLGTSKDFGIEWGTGAEGTMGSFSMGSRTTRAPWGWLKESWQPDSAGGAFGLSSLSFADADAFLQAIHQDTDTKVLARPKILTLDNEPAVIRVSTNQAIGFETTVDASTGTLTSEPERETTGIILVVTPQVNEGGYVTMLVEPSVTRVVQAEITAPDSSTVLDPKTRSARTLVRVRSGDTLIVGGLIDRSDSHSVRRVPVLSQIPVLGEAFKNVEINNVATELLVFLTPLILDESTSARVASASGPDSAYRPGLRPQDLREQDTTIPRRDAIEQALNALE